MKVTREEIIKLAMRADIHGQAILGANLRDAAARMNYWPSENSNPSKLDWRRIDNLERRILLNMDEIHEPKY